MEKVLLFQTDERTAGAVREILSPMKVRCECVLSQMFTKTIAELAQGGAAVTISGADRKKAFDAACGAGRGDADDAVPAGGHAFPFRESLMLFCDVSEKHFDRILALLKQKAVRIDYKAVLTPTNGQWNVLRLYAELARERAYYESLAIRGND